MLFTAFSPDYVRILVELREAIVVLELFEEFSSAINTDVIVIYIEDMQVLFVLETISNWGRASLRYTIVTKNSMWRRTCAFIAAPI